MTVVHISDVAYEEFKQLLSDNDITANVIRIYLTGMGCGGPAFNLVIDEQKENDVIEQVKDIKFIVEKDLINQFGSFTLKAGSENGRGALSIECEIMPEGCGCNGGCSSCG